ncbi:MAG: hypothetical protein M1823_006161, partial [Watsoniomyces obsoletus]
HNPTVEPAAPKVADNEPAATRRRRADDLWDDFEMEGEERELNADELAAEVERLKASNREGPLRQRYKELRKEQRALNTPLTSPPSIHRRSVTPARRPRSDSDDAPVDREHKRRMDIESKYAIPSPETRLLIGTVRVGIWRPHADPTSGRYRYEPQSSYRPYTAVSAGSV